MTFILTEGDSRYENCYWYRMMTYWNNNIWSILLWLYFGTLFWIIATYEYLTIQWNRAESSRTPLTPVGYRTSL